MGAWDAFPPIADGIFAAAKTGKEGQSRPLDESELIAAHLSRPDVTVFFHADAQARSEVDEFKNRAIVTIVVETAGRRRGVGMSPLRSVHWLARFRANVPRLLKRAPLSAGRR